MSPFHLSSTSRALYRVFVAPTLAAPLRAAQRTAPIPVPSATVPQFQRRTKVYNSINKVRHGLSDHFVLDRAIKSFYINLVDDAGKIRHKVPLEQALRSLNPKDEHLVQVAEGRTDAVGRPDPNFPPTCRITTKTELRSRITKKLDIARDAAKRTAGGAQKQLELNWAIGGNDLNHRLVKLKDFLMDGKKVEVLLAPKRKGRAASPEECENVIKKIKSVVAECQGASTAKAPEGKIGAMMTMVFEGKKLKKETKAAEAPAAVE